MLEVNEKTKVEEVVTVGLPGNFEEHLTHSAFRDFRINWHGLAVVASVANPKQANNTYLQSVEPLVRPGSLSSCTVGDEFAEVEKEEFQDVSISVVVAHRLTVKGR